MRMQSNSRPQGGAFCSRGEVLHMQCARFARRLERCYGVIRPLSCECAARVYESVLVPCDLV